MWFAISRATSTSLSLGTILETRPKVECVRWQQVQDLKDGHIYMDSKWKRMKENTPKNDMIAMLLLNCS